MLKKSRVKKQTEADLKRSWGIDPKHQLRYSGIAGIYWYYLSIQVRQEDFKKYKGKCVSCNTVLESWRDGDCGHFLASGNGGFATRFMRRNLSLQCKRCNNPSWTPDAPAFYAVELDKRHGAGTAASILALKGLGQKEMKKDEYAELIRELPSYKSGDSRTYTQT